MQGVGQLKAIRGDLVSLGQRVDAIRDTPEDTKGQRFLDTIPKLSEEDIDDRGDAVYFDTGVGKVSVIFKNVRPELLDDPEFLKIVYKLTQVSGALSIQRLFGVRQNGRRSLLVVESMDESSGHISFSRALGTRIHLLSTLHRLRICHELAVTVSYLHSWGIIVKVLSDWSVFFRTSPDHDNAKLRPVLADVGYNSRRVSYYIMTRLTDSRYLWIPTIKPMMSDTIHRSIRFEGTITKRQIYGG